MNTYKIIVTIKAAVTCDTQEQAADLAEALVAQELDDLNIEDHHFVVEVVSAEHRQLELDL